MRAVGFDVTEKVGSIALWLVVRHRRIADPCRTDPLIRAIRIMGEDRAMVVGEVLKSQERANKFNALDAPLGSGGCRQGAPVI
jgi:hypothetical protein